MLLKFFFDLSIATTLYRGIENLVWNQFKNVNFATNKKKLET